MNSELLKRWFIFPVLYPLSVVVNYFFRNILEASLNGFLTTFFITCIVVITIWLLFTLIFKDQQKTAILFFVTSALFFTFQNIIFILMYVLNRLFHIDLSIFFIGNIGQRIVFGSMLILILVIWFWVERLNPIKLNFILYLNIFSIALMAITLVKGSLDFYKHIKLMENIENYWEEQQKSISFSLDEINQEKPDIYYIILDGFARSDILFELYEIDNTDFIETLVNKGFYLANDSNSNYTQTRTSLASSLNMQYLHEVSESYGENKTNVHLAYHMIDNSIVEMSLRSIGYKMISFRSVNSYTYFRDWETYYQPKFVPDYYSQTFITTTALSVFMNSQMYQWHYDLINYVFDKMPAIKFDKTPKFVFAHLLCPHPPFIFFPDGSLMKADRLFIINDGNYYLRIVSEEEYVEGYKSQVLFLQDTVLKMIDELMKNANKPFIIILQADHGSGLQHNHEEMSKSNIKERLGILNAIYFSDQNYELLYPQISPVNTFRVVFSQYFNMNHPLLEDNHYYSNVFDVFDFTLVDDLLE